MGGNFFSCSGPNMLGLNVIYFRRIYEAYKTGKGIIYVRAKTTIEEDKSGNRSLIINEIPYMVNKAKMLEKID